MSDDSTIEELVRAAQRGDDLARTRLLGSIRLLIYRWALVHTASADDAEDITQQALLTVHRQLTAFHFEARFTTWLYTLTRRVAADWQRTRSRRARLLEAKPPDEVETYTTQRHAEHEPLLLLVREQLGTLPARQRELFDLVDLQGYTPLEAAALLDMNHNTVRVHLLRARRAIRARILARQPRIVEELQ